VGNPGPRGAPARWCREHLNELEERIRSSPLLFSPKTYLAGALARLRRPSRKTAGWLTRIVVLTDGEIMDSRDCGTLSATLPKGQEIRALGFGRGCNAGKIREAFRAADLGPVQQAASLDRFARQVEHLAVAGERLVGRDAKIAFSAERSLERVVCARPSVRLLESDRTYVYLLQVACSGDDAVEGHLEISYRSTAGQDMISLPRPFVLCPAWEHCRVAPEEVSLWVSETRLLREDEIARLIGRIRTLLSLMDRDPSADEAARRRLHEMLGRLEDGRRRLDAEYLESVEREIVDPMTRFYVEEDRS